MPAQTTPEILRTPLDELVLQVCLLHEQQRDYDKGLPQGVSPSQFLSRTIESPPEENHIKACDHLLEVGALQLLPVDPPRLYRLTPLGYHLSRLPVDSKVGKTLIVGCMLKCLDNALTIAAALSSTKSCFQHRWGNVAYGKWEAAIESRNELVRSGFGGETWPGGNVKGDLIATIAVFREWSKNNNYRDRAIFCSRHAVDNSALYEIQGLRSQLRDCLEDAGFLKRGIDFYNTAKEDALLTSCCLVAGLYPNICTLFRPTRKGGIKGGRLLTKEEELCLPSSNSFQSQRIRTASECGKDAYAVFHAKHRSVTTSTGDRPAPLYLSEVNFVSRFALLLFGGDLEVKNNAVIVDGWLKFKVGRDDKDGKACVTNAVLIQQLRTALDNMALRHLLTAPFSSGIGSPDGFEEVDTSLHLIKVVRQLLAEE